MNNQTRWKWLDAVKGTGILLVMISHICALPPYLGNGCIPLFFIIAGYTAHQQDFKTLVSQKAKRLLIPYLFYGLIFLFLFSLLAHKFDLAGFTGLFYSRYSLYPLNEQDNVFLLKQNSPLWFASAMFITYLEWYIYCRIAKNTLQNINIIVLCFVLSIILYHIQILLPWSMDISFFFLICMIYGKYVNNYSINLFNKKYSICYAGIAVLYLMLSHYNGGSNLSVKEYGNLGALSIFMDSFIALGEALLLGWMFQLIGENSIITRTFAFIGKHSLRLMCIHLPIFFIANGIFSSANEYLLVIGKLTAAIVASIIIAYFTCKLHLKYL